MSEFSDQLCWGNSVQVVILCGGLGTRLRPAIPKGIPKSMAKVGKEPFLKSLIGYLHGCGARKFIFALGYKADMIRDYLDQKSWPNGVEFKYSVEATALGTAGALINCVDQIYTDDVFVVNGDTFAIFDYAEMYELHKAKGSKITMALASVPNSERYGSVELSIENEIIGFEEKVDSQKGPGLINAGVYLFKCKALDTWPANRPLSLERDVLPSFVGSGLSAYLSEIKFIDIGTPESYIQANDFLQNLKL